MTESAAPLLLARDREQLDRVVRSIRDERRGFFVIVCAPELRPAAVRYLAETSGKGIAEPGLVSGHDEMVERMGVLDGKPAGSVEGFRIDAADVDVFTALNWHREKVRRAGQVILWLDSVEGLEELQRHAPDAYSFREGVLVLAGEGVPNTEWEAEEPPDVKTARLLYELPRPPEERAEAAVELAALLHARERVNEPLAVISEGLGLIPGAQYATQTHRMTRARLLEVLGLIANSRGCRIDAFRAYQRALQELGSDLSSRGARFHVSLALASSALSPLGANAAILKESVEWLATETDPAAVFLVHHWVADSARHRGAFELAVAHHTLGLATPGVRSADKVHTLLMRCDTLREMGRFREADEDVSAADAASLRAGIARAWAQTYRAGLLRDKGEVAAAASIAQHVAESPESAAMAPPWCNFFRGTLGPHSGTVHAFAIILRESVTDLRDRLAFDACSGLLRLLGQAADASALAQEDLARSLDIIDSAGRALIEYAAGDPPWYDVLFPGLRASVLSLEPSHQAEAIATATEAIALARSLWPQALPLSTRILVQCLARAARWPDMEPAILDALQCAREADHLRELATVQAYDLVRLLHLAAPRAALEKALADLKATFSEMGAPRVEGETWLEIAPFFPPLTAFPDPLEIADRAHGLFLDMPMPEPAARCLEWLGDVYVARGASAEASSCYRMSLGTLQRYGLLLRKPLVEKKLAALTGGSSPGPGSVPPGNG